MYHYVREMVDIDMVTIKYVNTKYNIADLFTKGVPKEVFNFLSPYLMGDKPINELLNLIKDQGGQSKVQSQNGLDGPEINKEISEPNPDINR